MLRSFAIALMALLLSACSTDSSTSIRSSELARWIPDPIEVVDMDSSISKEAVEAPITDSSADHRSDGSDEVTEASADSGSTDDPDGEVYPITLDVVLAIAKDQALSIQLARQRLEAAAATQQISTAAFLPTIGPRADYSRTDGAAQGTDGTVVDVSKNSLFSGIELRFDLDPWGDWHRFQAAQDNLVATEQLLYWAEEFALHRGALLFHDLIRSHGEIKIAQRSVLFSHQLSLTAQSRLDAGDGLREDLLAALAKEAASDRDLVLARSQTKIASARLAEFLVLTEDTSFDPILVPASDQITPNRFEMDQWSGERLVHRGLERRPDLVAARAKVEAARSLSRASSAWGRPTISARSRIGRFGIDSADQSDQETAEVGIGWQFGLESTASHRRSVATFEETQLEAKKLELRIVTQIRISMARLQASRAAMTAARRQLEAGEEAMKLTESRYKAGAALLDELLGREADLAAARTASLNSIISHNQAQFDLILSVGGP
ncbi:MAG TPA: TolC family protein [Planctomycetes bacterium]|nr:TolC family protein [Planctomycetota bacterium]